MRMLSSISSIPPSFFILVSHTYISTLDKAKIIYHKTLPQDRRIALATELGATLEQAITLGKQTTDLRQLKIAVNFTDKIDKREVTAHSYFDTLSALAGKEALPPLDWVAHNVWRGTSSSKMDNIAAFGEDLCVIDMLGADYDDTRVDLGIAILPNTLKANNLLGHRTSLSAPPATVPRAQQQNGVTRQGEVWQRIMPTKKQSEIIREDHHGGFISGSLLDEVRDFTLAQDFCFCLCLFSLALSFSRFSCFSRFPRNPSWFTSAGTR